MNGGDLLERPRVRVRLDPEICAPAVLDGLLEGRFTANGETHTIGDPVDWMNNPSDDIEWHIVLHKFFHAPALVHAWKASGDTRYLEICKTQVSSWIDRVAPGFIAADVTGRRIRNWVYMLALLDGDEPHFANRVEQSLRTQTGWLSRNLHPARNHRTLELFALFIASLWLGDGPSTDFALAALADNAEADFLPDGAHVELSSHYHCIALRNLVETIELARDNGLAVPQRLQDTVARACHFGHALHKPDGTIPMLSDADTGDYRALLGAPPELGKLEVFADAGYVFLRDDAALAGETHGSYLVFDCGDIGAGNHGHLDCLSFEFASRGRSLIVDPGRYSYNEKTVPNWRAAFRQTRAHNLVQVDGLEQTRYAQGPGRMKVRGPSPRARLTAAIDLGETRFVRAEARSAEYPVVLERGIVAHDRGWWLVCDRMAADSCHRYDLLFQLDPMAQDRAHLIELPGGNRAVLSPNMLLVPLASHPSTLALEQGWIAPRYGEKHAAPRIVCSIEAANAWFATLIVPFDGDIPSIAFESDGAVARIDGAPIDLSSGAPC